MDDSQNADAPISAELGAERDPSSRPRTLGRRRKWAITTAVVGALVAVPTVAFTINGSASAATTPDYFTVLGLGATANEAQVDAQDKANSRCGAGKWAADSDNLTGSDGDWTDDLAAHCLTSN